MVIFFELGSMKVAIVKSIYAISLNDKKQDFKINGDIELQENRGKIKLLIENNKVLSLKVATLSKNI